MYMCRVIAEAAVIACMASSGFAQDVGRPVSESDIAALDITVLPDGTNLPAGQGSVADGVEIFRQSCAACHGATGTEGPANVLVGGIGSLASDTPVKTVGSYWPYAPGVFDYVRRVMPYWAPGSLTDDQAYAVTAYLLHLNGIVGPDAEMNAKALAAVKMPNRRGFITYWPEPPK